MVMAIPQKPSCPQKLLLVHFEIQPIRYGDGMSPSQCMTKRLMATAAARILGSLTLVRMVFDGPMLTNDRVRPSSSSGMMTANWNGGGTRLTRVTRRARTMQGADASIVQPDSQK